MSYNSLRVSSICIPVYYFLFCIAMLSNISVAIYVYVVYDRMKQIIHSKKLRIFT